MSLASSSSCDGMPSKIHVESVGFRRPQMTRTTMSGVTRIARLPTLVTPPPEGNLQLIAATTPISTASPPDGDECSGRGMVPIDRRTGILTARRKDARKGQLIVSNERKKAAQVRPDSLPQVATNGCIRSKVNAMQPRARTTVTEVADCPEPPVMCRTLPPLGNCSRRRKKPPRLEPIPPGQINDTMSESQQPSVVISAVSPLAPLRRSTPAQEEIAQLVTPNSERPRSVIVELGIQTDDNFDREAAALVEQLVTSAISRATDSLKKEAEIAHLRRQAQNYKKLLEKLQQSTKLTIEEKNKVIESLQQEEARRLTRNLAEETCDQITKSSMNHVEKLNETPTKTRSIGLDTRSMSSHLTKLQLMTTELEQDFFPWMFAKADQMFRRTMTTIQLENLLIRRSSFRRKKFEII